MAVLEEQIMMMQAPRDELQRDIVRSVQRVVRDGSGVGTLRCDLERDGPRLVVHLRGPVVGEGVEKAIAVRVLDAIWRSGSIHGPVNVEYQAVEGVAGVVRESGGGRPAPG
jgi:hypothetical protein